MPFSHLHLREYTLIPLIGRRVGYSHAVADGPLEFCPACPANGSNLHELAAGLPNGEVVAYTVAGMDNDLVSYTNSKTQSWELLGVKTGDAYFGGQHFARRCSSSGGGDCISPTQPA